MSPPSSWAGRQAPDRGVLVFDPGVALAATPRRTIAGAPMALPFALASSLFVAYDGTVYVGCPSTIRVFAPGADGDVAPSRTLSVRSAPRP